MFGPRFYPNFVCAVVVDEVSFFRSPLVCVGFLSQSQLVVSRSPVPVYLLVSCIHVNVLLMSIVNHVEVFLDVLLLKRGETNNFSSSYVEVVSRVYVTMSWMPSFFFKLQDRTDVKVHLWMEICARIEGRQRPILRLNFSIILHCFNYRAQPSLAEKSIVSSVLTMRSFVSTMPWIQKSVIL